MLQTYSLILAFGPIPIKITLVYIKDFVQVVDLIILALGTVSIGLSLAVGLTTTDSTVVHNAMMSFVYNLITYLPIMLFGVPFYFYCDFMQTYLKNHYPTLYSGKFVELLQETVPRIKKH